MADTRVEMAPGADAALRDAVAAGLEKLFDKRLGPDITADAERGCPKLTGRLSASLRFRIDRSARLPSLIVGSFPDDKGRVPYAAAVEMGFHGMEAVRSYVTKTGRRVPARIRRGNTPEQPYLRPALYRKRSA
jgi:hypothetical protein